MFITSFSEGATDLDLVAHFLGVATHDNINAAPAGDASDKFVSSGHWQSAECVSILLATQNQFAPTFGASRRTLSVGANTAK